MPNRTMMNSNSVSTLQKKHNELMELNKQSAANIHHNSQFNTKIQYNSAQKDFKLPNTQANSPMGSIDTDPYRLNLS